MLQASTPFKSVSTAFRSKHLPVVLALADRLHTARPHPPHRCALYVYSGLQLDATGLIVIAT